MESRAHAENLPIWLRPQAIALFVALVLAVRFAVASATGLVRDEGYYTLWSFWPAAGYLDHPPMVAWLIATGRAVAGESEAGVRLFAVLSSAIVSFAVYRTGRLLLDARTAGLAVIWYNLTVASGLMFLATPDAPLVAFWALCVWAVAEFEKGRDARWWLLAGVFAGAALLSKYTAGFLGLGLLLYLVTSRERRGWLRLWQVWAGGALALLVWLPNLVWNLANGWVSVGFQGRRLDGYGTGSDPLANLGELLAGQALAVGVFLFVFVVIGAALFATRRDLSACRGLALPLLTSLPAVVFFLGYAFRFRVEANWPIMVWPMLSLVGAWAAMHYRPRGRLVVGTLAVMRNLQAPLGALLVGLVYAQAVWQPLPSNPAIDRTRDMRGWAEVSAAVRAAADANDAAWIAVTRDYGIAGELAAYGRFAGEARPVRAVDDPRRYGFVPPLDPALIERPAILVTWQGTSVDAVEAFFAEVTRLDDIERRQRDGEVLERLAVFRVAGPLQDVVARLRKP